MLDIAIKVTVTKTATDAEVAAALEPAVASLMRAMLGRAKRLVPKKSWDLHNSLGTEVTREGANVVGVLYAGGGVVDYAEHVERGTSRARAQPYLRPALLQSKAADLRGAA